MIFKRPIRTFLLVLLLACVNNCMAQHFLDGTWVGNYNNNSISFIDISPVKVVLNIEVTSDNRIRGTSHLYYRGKNHYEHYIIHGYYNPNDSTIFLSEDSVIAVRGFLNLVTCTGDYKMKLSATDSMLSLNGGWKENANLDSGCGKFTVWFNKPIMQLKPAIDSSKKDISEKNKKPVKPDTSLHRLADVQKLIEIDRSEMDSIKIELKDNAQIDGDAVSVYFNNQPIIHNESLTAKPIVFYLSIPQNASISNLKMVAESMGSVPPCTATMIISTRKKTYEVTLSSNMNNNSVVQFFLKE